MQLKLRSFPAALLMLSAACGDSASKTTLSPDAGSMNGDGDADADSGSPSPDAGLGPDAVVGAVEVQLIAPSHSFVFGKVSDKPAVPTTLWEEADSEGGCQLLKPRVPFCDDGCGSDACVEDNTCEPFELALNAGTLTVSGLRDKEGASTPFSIEPQLGNYTTPGEVKLPYPPFDEGDIVSVTASGGEVSAFKLTGTAIASLKLSSEGALPLVDGEPLLLEWTPKGAKGDSHILVSLDISHHGGTKGKIVCETADDGSFAIPAKLVSALKALGTAGFPSIVITRRSLSSVLTSAGRVELKIYENQEREIAIDGLISCSNINDCPEGQACRDDLTCG